MRINRFLASAGLGSRRGVENLIREGRVTVNGRVVTDLSTAIGEKDAVKVNNKLIQEQGRLYVLLNKPAGYLCTASDEKGRRTIYDLLPKTWPKLAHAGRLDKESEGLIILTNDGDLALHLTHPRYKVEKEYHVVLDREYDPAHTEKLLRGFLIEGGRAKMESVHVTGMRSLTVILRQGIKRQIRLMFYQLGYEVETLSRTRIGPITGAGVSTGEWRMLAKREVEWLMHPEKAPQLPKREEPDFIPRRSGPKHPRGKVRVSAPARQPRENRQPEAHRGEPQRADAPRGTRQVDLRGNRPQPKRPSAGFRPRAKGRKPR